jgi:hypothetical protein
VGVSELDRLATERSLDIRDRTDCIEQLRGGAREDGKSLASLVECLLDTGENTRNIARDHRVL